jgi:hypothetical protein
MAADRCTCTSSTGDSRCASSITARCRAHTVAVRTTFAPPASVSELMPVLVRRLLQVVSRRSLLCSVLAIPWPSLLDNACPWCSDSPISDYTFLYDTATTCLRCLSLSALSPHGITITTSPRPALLLFYLRQCSFVCAGTPDLDRALSAAPSGDPAMVDIYRREQPSRLILAERHFVRAKGTRHRHAPLPPTVGPPTAVVHVTFSQTASSRRQTSCLCVLCGRGSMTRRRH